MNYSKPVYSLDEAKRKLERYCAYQERCHKDVNNKLKEMGMIPIAIDEIITHLIRHDFLNETRFSKAFARGKFRIKKWGRVRITRELKARAISVYNIKAALQEISEQDYLDTFNELAARKNSSLREANRLKKRKKLADYLLYRGWESHLVYEKIKELIL
jgi:regulatory protein